jgi:hypothetical protein
VSSHRLKKSAKKIIIEAHSKTAGCFDESSIESFCRTHTHTQRRQSPQSQSLNKRLRYHNITKRYRCLLHRWSTQKVPVHEVDCPTIIKNRHATYSGEQHTDEVSSTTSRSTKHIQAASIIAIVLRANDKDSQGAASTKSSDIRSNFSTISNIISSTQQLPSPFLYQSSTKILFQGRWRC